LPGCEINTDDGHFLAFGLKEYSFGMHKLSFLRQKVDQVGGILIAAHPYRRRKIPTVPTILAGTVDKTNPQDGRNLYYQVIEGLNGRGTKEENAFSLNLATIQQLKVTGSSDSHQTGDLETYATKFLEKIECLDDLIRNLKKGSFYPVCLRTCDQT